MVLGNMMNNYMTKSDVLEYMRNNHFAKVTHWLFDEKEYLYMAPDGKVYTEEGYLFEDFHSLYQFDGMRMRTGDSWEIGWSKYENDKC